MHVLSLITALAASISTVSALALPISITQRDVGSSNTTTGGFLKVTPGPIHDMIVSEETTLNGTYTGDGEVIPPKTDSISAESTLPLAFVNNFGSDISAYLTGQDDTGAVCFILADGTLVYPSSGGSATPVAITQTIKMDVAAGATISVNVPITLISARIYFSAGDLAFSVVWTGAGEGLVQPAPNNPSDPSAGVNWGFIEFTLNADGSIYANISYVDFVGMPLGMQLTVNGGDTQSAYGVQSDSVATLCADMQTQAAADGRPWDQLCMAGTDGPIRILSPTKYSDIDPTGFADYWQSYVDAVWTQYTSSVLTIDTQSDAGQVACQVTDDTLNCAGDNRGYAKPIATDIWGCNGGPFASAEGDNAIHLAVIPRLCAAFERSTLLLEGGNVQPSLSDASYYTVDPTNHYSAAVHTVEVDGKGYAFAYDDVNAGTENASGTVSSGTPNTLTVYIGAPPA